MHQLELDMIHARVCDVIAYYEDNLITTAEFILKIRGIPEVTYDDLAGLVDPNTGLRFPPLRHAK